MLSIQDALALLRAQGHSLTWERLPLEAALGRVLPRPLVSPLDSPPFDKSAMDGWAIRKEDEEGPWESLGTIAAGGTSSTPLAPGQCVAVMTGAPLPEGCGKVVRVEYTRQEGQRVILTGREEHSNIIRQGESVKRGEPLLDPCRLGPKELGILASVGIAQVEVARPPRVGVLTTGSEIREPGESLQRGEIYNSNGPQLLAQVRQEGCPVHYYGVVRDDSYLLRETIQRALEEEDLLLLSGGVSQGNFDFVPEVLEDLGVQKVFHKLAIKPGKPLWFGRRGNRFVFGLPGNPMSAYVLFEVFIRGFIRQFCGLVEEVKTLQAVLGQDIPRKVCDRPEFLPACLREGKIFPLDYRGSFHLNALAGAQGLICVDQGRGRLKAGEVVNARLL